MQTAAQRKWLTVGEVFDRLGISHATWDKWRGKDHAPRAKRLPNVRLRVDEEWPFIFDLP